LIQILRINAQALPGMAFARARRAAVNPGEARGAREKGGVRIAKAACLVRKEGVLRPAGFTAR
jgi:hypothetical protein